jgi:phosphoribosylglycinamide formyltransferase-1
MIKITNIAVLISGNGSNLQAILDAIKNDEDFGGKIVLVISNKPEAYGLLRAKNYSVDTLVLDHKLYATRQEYDEKLDEICTQNNIDIICLAGFMRLLTPWLTNKWENKIINIHPSLLPSFKGLNAVSQALKYGVKITGCTVHYVDSEMDTGKIIMQKSVEVLSHDDEFTLAEKIHKIEHEIYPKALKYICKEN